MQKNLINIFHNKTQLVAEGSDSGPHYFSLTCQTSSALTETHCGFFPVCRGRGLDLSLTRMFLEPAATSGVRASASKEREERVTAAALDVAEGQRGWGRPGCPLSGLPGAPGSRPVITHLADIRRKNHRSAPHPHPLFFFFFFFFQGGFLPSLNETLSLKDCNPQQMTSEPNLVF